MIARSEQEPLGLRVVLGPTGRAVWVDLEVDRPGPLTDELMQMARNLERLY